MLFLMSLVKLTVSQSEGHRTFVNRVYSEMFELNPGIQNEKIQLRYRSRCSRSEAMEQPSSVRKYPTDIIRLLIKIPKLGKSQLTCPLPWQIAKIMSLVQMQKLPMGTCNHRSMNPSKPATLGWSDRTFLVANKSRIPHIFFFSYLLKADLKSHSHSLYLLSPLAFPGLSHACATREDQWVSGFYVFFHTRYFSLQIVLKNQNEVLLQELGNKSIFQK